LGYQSVSLESNARLRTFTDAEIILAHTVATPLILDAKENGISRYCQKKWLLRLSWWLQRPRS